MSVPVGVNVGLHGLSFYNGSNTSQNGGGVRAFGNTNVSHAAFVDCSAGFGGGLWAGDGRNYVFVVLENCTFTGNASANSGSAFGGNGAFIEARHCTIYQNNGIAGGIFPGHTAGTYFAGTATVLRAGNCVVADNLRRNGTTLNFFFQGAGFQDLGFNLSTSGPGLSRFQNWGGMAWGHRPLAAGLCENAGDPNILILPARDQLGAPRVEDGRVDIGAIEFGQCTFQQRYPGLMAFEDEDGDGWTNIEEYAYSLNPFIEDDFSNEPTFHFTDLKNDARREQWVTFFLNSKATDIAIRVEQSFDLETWPQVPFEISNGVLVNSRGTITHEDPEVTAVIEDANETQAFMRLKVSQ
jgi:hypothetical protein